MVYASNQADLLDRSVGPIKIKCESIDEILETLSDSYKIPIGISLADTKKSPDRQIDVNLPEMVLKSVLDFLVMQDPRYKWKVEGNVVNFFPIKDFDPLVMSLLDTNLSRVSFSSQLRLSDIRYEIFDLSEINAKLIQANVAPLMFEMGIPSTDKIGASLKFSNLSLRELLNQIALNTSRRFWRLTRWGDDNKYIALTL
jgi:hypothetical protein